MECERKLSLLGKM